MRKLKGFDPENDLVCGESSGVPSGFPAEDSITSRSCDARPQEQAKTISVLKNVSVNAGSPVHGSPVPVPCDEGRTIIAAATEKGDLLFLEPRGDGLSVTGKIALSGTITASPSYGSGMVFCGTSEGMVYAIRTTFGDDLPGRLRNRVEWQRKMKKGNVAGPAAGEGFVLVSQPDGIHALDTAGERGKLPGSVLWGAAVGGTASPRIKGNMILAGTEDRRLILFDYSAEQPAVVWQCDIGGPCRSTPAVCAEYGIAAAGTADGYVYCAGLVSGERRWSFNAGSPVLRGITCSVAGAGGCLFFGTEKGIFYSLDSSGRKVWETDAGGRIMSEASCHDGLLYFGCGDDMVLCLDALTGKKVFGFGTDGAVTGRPVRVEESIYFGTVRGTVYRLITG